jgi:hypothetical protein
MTKRKHLSSAFITEEHPTMWHAVLVNEADVPAIAVGDTAEIEGRQWSVTQSRRMAPVYAVRAGVPDGHAEFVEYTEVKP